MLLGEITIGVGVGVAIAPSVPGIAITPLAIGGLGEFVAVVGEYAIGFPGPTGGGTDKGAAVGPNSRLLGTSATTGTLVPFESSAS